MPEEITEQVFEPLALMILTTRDEVPLSVAIPVTDWLKLKPSLHPQNPLYQLFEKLELEGHTAPGALSYDQPEDAEPDSTYIRYKDDTCKEDQVFIQEYAGRTARVRAHPKVDTFEFLEEIN